MWAGPWVPPGGFEIGFRLPMHASATGLAILAFLAPEEIETVLNGLELNVRSPHTLRTPAAPDERLVQIRRDGLRDVRRGAHPWAAIRGRADHRCSRWRGRGNFAREADHNIDVDRRAHSPVCAEAPERGRAHFDGPGPPAVCDAARRVLIDDTRWAAPFGNFWWMGVAADALYVNLISKRHLRKAFFQKVPDRVLTQSFRVKV